MSHVSCLMYVVALCRRTFVVRSSRLLTRLRKLGGSGTSGRVPLRVSALYLRTRDFLSSAAPGEGEGEGEV